jgi:glycosyltransferase involved in cell wall biosynthesis
MRAQRPAPDALIVAPGGLRGRGGIGSLVRTTVQQWETAGLQPPLRVVDSYGERLSAMTAMHFVRALATVTWRAARGRIALVHVHMASRGSALRKSLIVRLAARLGVPIVLHFHGSRLDEEYAQLRPSVRRALHVAFARADRIVVPGTYWRTLLVDKIGVDSATVHVVANAAAGPPEVAVRPPGPPCRLLFVGKLSAAKGLPDLLEGLADPEVAALDWRLRVAGTGDLVPFAAQTARLGIADRVELCGWVTPRHLRSLLDETDVFVLPSRNEGLSIALLEAMAHGCAVVTTPVGATCEAVRDGVSALLVAPGNHAALARALHRVITDPTLRAALQAGARQRWREHFDIAAHCRQLAELYRELCPSLDVWRC